MSSINVVSRPASPVHSVSSVPSLVAESLIEETNTLILTSLTPEFFYEDVLVALKDHFSSYGDLYAWAPLKSFGRIIIVFWNSDDAGRARVECDKLWLSNEDGTTLARLRLYRGAPTPIDPEPVKLPVPHTTKNFLISPPGSPPIGWEPTEEEAPNTTALASDLVLALQRLQFQQKHAQKDGIQVLMTPDDEDEDNDVTMVDGDAPASSSANGGSSSPQKPKGLSVFLQDCDYVAPSAQDDAGTASPDEADGVWEGEMMRGGIGRVKATVASMHLTSHTPSLGAGLATSLPARVPTPRPPPPS